MKNKTYFKNLIRMIFKTKARFLSIFLIVFLGASFFAGLRQTPDIMQASMDNYIQEYNFNDIEAIGTLGYNQEDINKIKSIKEVKNVDYGFRYDGLVYKGDSSYGCIVYTSNFKNHVNDVKLSSGKMPTKDDECIFDSIIAERYNYKLNDEITIESSNSKKTYKIVGFGFDTRYISDMDRGTNTLGDGTNDAFVLTLTQGNESMALPQDLYDLREETVLYTDLRITLNDDYNVFSDNYREHVSSVKSKVQKLLKNNYNELHTALEDKANKQIADGQKSYDEGLQQYNDGIQQYEDGLQQYNNGLQQYNDGYAKYQQGQRQYQSGLKQYNDGLTAYNQGLQEYKQGKQQYEQGLNSYNVGLQQYNAGVQQYESGLASYQQLEQSISFLENNEIAYNQAVIALPGLSDQYNANPSDTLLQQIQSLKTLINTYEGILQQVGSLDEAKKLAVSSKAQLDATKLKLDSTSDDLVKAKTALDDNNLRLDNAQDDLYKAKNQLDETKLQLSNTNDDLVKAKYQLDTTKQQLDSAKNTLDTTKQQLDEVKLSLDEAKKGLDSAKKQVKDIPTGKSIYLTSEENASLISYQANCDSIEALSILFPMIFFLVAALVSLTTMTRMIEEQRVQSGVLRALGYTNAQVINQYLIYAFLATFIAALIGTIFGTNFFPSIIYHLYTLMMYQNGTPVKIVYVASTVIQTFVISVAITLIVSYVVTRKELVSMPATLLRPKAPKMGKRIVLERITPIWKRLTFIQKVTMRNIFRYKKRFIMSIIGIAGCTALIVVGFGVKYSIAPLVDNQTKEIWHYDGVVKYNRSLGQDSINQTSDLFIDSGAVESICNFYNKTVSVDKNYYAQLEVPQLNNFDDFIKLTDYQTGEALKISDQGVIINQKLSELANVSVGDDVTIDINDKEYKVKVSGIARYYFQHYVYMSPTFYSELTGEEAILDNSYINLNNDDSKVVISEVMDGNDDISSVTYIRGMFDEFENQISSIDSVVVILIACAALLNFIVLYNLTNINIQERKSEIATIKVLGFYRKEVYQYVFRENIILGIIGAVLGLGLGTLVHGYLIRTVEIDMAMFVRSVNPICYLFAFLLTIIFIKAINFVMRKVLIKIDMVESLKSIE